MISGKSAGAVRAVGLAFALLLSTTSLAQERRFSADDLPKIVRIGDPVPGLVMDGVASDDLTFREFGEALGVRRRRLLMEQAQSSLGYSKESLVALASCLDF